MWWPWSRVSPLLRPLTWLLFYRSASSRLPSDLITLLHCRLLLSCSLAVHPHTHARTHARTPLSLSFLPSLLIFYLVKCCSSQPVPETMAVHTECNVAVQCHAHKTAPICLHHFMPCACCKTCMRLGTSMALCMLTRTLRTLPYSTLLYSTLLYSTQLNSTLLYSTLLYSTVIAGFKA